MQLVEGQWADQYTADTAQQILQTYKQRYCAGPNPLSHPELFDPLVPPQGYRYDPYYEMWCQL